MMFNCCLYVHSFIKASTIGLGQLIAFVSFHRKRDPVVLLSIADVAFANIGYFLYHIPCFCRWTMTSRA